MKTALTIAGSDSGGGAGIQADLKTFAAHGVYGTSALTAVTAQNTVGVTAAFPLSAELVIAQMEAVAADIEIHAAKTGMLATAAIVEAVAATINELDLPFLVVDPVMIAKSGDRLLDTDAVGAIKTELLTRAYLVTPNAMEASVLAGMPVSSLSDAIEAAKRIRKLGPRAVIVKGGHLHERDVIDVLYDGHESRQFAAERIGTRNTHGTGCTFSAAITANLALGFGLADSVERAKEYVTGAILHGLSIGKGHGPLDHFWRGAPSRP
jgi:hydroxymethylpyrimidine/phosphomethylpyrimidine kinase